MARPLCVRPYAGPSSAILARRILRDEPPRGRRTYGLPGAGLADAGRAGGAHPRGAAAVSAGGVDRRSGALRGRRRAGGRGGGPQQGRDRAGRAGPAHRRRRAVWPHAGRCWLRGECGLPAGAERARSGLGGRYPRATRRSMAWTSNRSRPQAASGARRQTRSPARPRRCWPGCLGGAWPGDRAPRALSPRGSRQPVSGSAMGSVSLAQPANLSQGSCVYRGHFRKPQAPNGGGVPQELRCRLALARDCTRTTHRQHPLSVIDLHLVAVRNVATKPARCDGPTAALSRCIGDRARW
jgi:hypothetical protein